MTDGYRALTLLWHTKAEAYVQPGDTVDLSHLTPEEIEYLVELGAVEPIAPKRQRRQEATNGTTPNSDQPA